jgi:hypothetical protein
MFCPTAVLRATVRNSANFLIRSLTRSPPEADGECARCAVQFSRYDIVECYLMQLEVIFERALSLEVAAA